MQARVAQHLQQVLMIQIDEFYLIEEVNYCKYNLTLFNFIHKV